ncbi:MAG: hypothetical protein HUJ54_06960 [Erysipelotrichaceae bacterium]|nr:hypothetical protein [Erysipelotrichaceae bacterium]
MKSNFAQRITALLFSAAIIGMFAFTLVSKGVTLVMGQKKELTAVAAAHEQEKEKAKTSGNSLKNLMDSFSEDMPGKKEGAAFATAVTKAVSGNTYIESTQVLLGKDNWLFYKSPEDGDPMSDYIGEDRYTAEEMVQAAETLGAVEDYFAQRGVPFAALYIPNKSSVYPELMPDTVIRTSDYSKSQELMDFLKNNTALNIINAYDSLMEVRKDRQIYYSTDTHFNSIGCFTACMDLLNAFQLPTQPLSTVTFKETSKTWAGDLSIICNMQEEFAQDTFYTLDQSTVDPNAKNGKKLLLVGDSFGEGMASILKNYFDQVEFINIVAVTPEQVMQSDADYVVWESCERYTERFFDQKLLAQ